VWHGRRGKAKPLGILQGVLLCPNTCIANPIQVLLFAQITSLVIDNSSKVNSKFGSFGQENIMADLSTTIETAAGNPSSASVDGQSVNARPLTEVIEADRYLKGNDALAGTNLNSGPRSGWGCLRTARAIPPGAV
jgi:hypothetical protein